MAIDLHSERGALTLGLTTLLGGIALAAVAMPMAGLGSCGPQNVPAFFLGLVGGLVAFAGFVFSLVLVARYGIRALRNRF